MFCYFRWESHHDVAAGGSGRGFSMVISHWLVKHKSHHSSPEPKRQKWHQRVVGQMMMKKKEMKKLGTQWCNFKIILVVELTWLEKRRVICYLLGGRFIQLWGKVPKTLSNWEPYSSPRAQFFLNTDQPRLVNKLFTFYPAGFLFPLSWDKGR